MSKNKHNLKAFTFIELSVCVLIIAVVTAIGVPLYFENLEEARGARALENLNLIRSAEILYLVENSEYTANVAALQTYTNFIMVDPEWIYNITSTSINDFMASATRTAVHPNYNGKIITIDHLSNIIIDGTSVANGGTWPP